MSRNAAGRPKVLFLPKWYPNRFDPLDGIFVVDHAKAAALAADVCVLFVHSDPELNGRVQVTTTTDGSLTVRTVYFRYWRTGYAIPDQLQVAILYLFRQFQAYRAIRKSWGKPDVVHVHVLLRTALLALYLKWRHRIPFLVTEHWSGYDPSVGYRIGRIKKHCIRFVLGQAAGITTVSAYAQKHLQRFRPDGRFEVVSNAVDEQLFRIRERLPRNKYRFIHISTLDDYPKNFGAILEVMAELTAVRDDFELYVIGKGVESEKQQERARTLGLLDTVVFFKGFLPKEEVALHLAQSDALLLFSHYETQSCVLLEAFLSGVPVIASAVGGVCELVRPENGILVEPLNNRQLYEACRIFLDGETGFNPAAIREGALGYSYEAVGEQFARLYREVRR